MHQVLQDLQQIRTICQQLAQNERQNAQHLSTQPGLQAMAQRESFAAQQLQQCVSLCQRIEQQIAQQQMQQQMTSARVAAQFSPTPAASTAHYGTAPGAGYGSAPRMSTTVTATPHPGTFAAHSTSPMGFGTHGAHGPAASANAGVNLAGLRAAMQADKVDGARPGSTRPYTH
ncbi:MAG: hypothetical protein IRZ10_12200 [Thermoflavifilum sp.]|nr:hypothetical protein [Thermoflavifilum sp.]MCL6515162.1 hypothetical protein [Alicyclobacillus sp.]